MQAHVVREIDEVFYLRFDEFTRSCARVRWTTSSSAAEEGVQVLPGAHAAGCSPRRDSYRCYRATISAGALAGLAVSAGMWRGEPA